jgi:hypothetical protein
MIAIALALGASISWWMLEGTWLPGVGTGLIQSLSP